ncbi:MAG: hypothetical protein M5U28_44130 [Sandaracinaceae bacterium]|nr:hypothetical protein [Sandaracinaceae bacterium]
MLRADLTIDAETDSEEAVDLFIGAVNVHRIDAELRFQPVVGAARFARRRAARIPEGPPGVALAYRGPSPAGDAVPYPAALDVYVRADTHGANIEIIPGILGVIICAFNPDPACVFLTQELQRLAEVGLQRAFKGIGSMIDTLVASPSLQVQNAVVRTLAPQVCDYLTAGPGSCPLSGPARTTLVANSIIDLGASTVTVPFSRTSVTFGAPGGVFTPTTMLALASGGTFDAVMFDFSRVGQVCGTATCAGPAPTDARCRVCAECAALAPAVPAVCNFGTPALLTINQPSAPRPDQAILNVLAVQIPPSPTYAAIMDMVPNLVLELHGMFSGPLAEAALRDGSRYRYTSARYEASSIPGQPGSAVFQFTGPGPDTDRDGVPDIFDVCPEIADPMQQDTDGDSVGDACDGCPCVSSPITTDLDGDGIQDPCDCDMDADGCNNQIEWDTTLPGCATATICPSTGERRTVCIGSACMVVQEAFDQVPRGCDERNRDGTCANTDALLPGGDAFIDDCDLDDDADGVDDDGAGDGFEVYTPCPDGVTVGCDDNCENVPNPTQFDSDDDGSGDLCDGFDDGSVPPPDRFFDPSGIGGAGFSPGFGMECLRDGPSCFAWLVFGCEAGIGGLCGQEFDYVEVYARRGDLMARFDAADYVGAAKWGGAYATLPDVDGDGVEELALGAPRAAGMRDGALLAEAGAVVALGSWTLDELWRLSGPDEDGRFGSALARGGALLLVGAPAARNATGVRTGAVTRVELLGAPFARGASFGQAAREEFGAAIAPFGDPDVPGRLLGFTIGSPGASGAGNGAGRIYFSTTTGALVGVIEGPGPHARLGARIATILPNAFKGARPGILAGAPNARSGRGMVLLYDLAGREIWRIEGARGERLGESVTFGADFDGDGFEEALVGAPGANRGAGRAYIVNSSGLLQTFLDGVPGARVGAGVSAPGRSGSGRNSGCDPRVSRTPTARRVTTGHVDDPLGRGGIEPQLGRSPPRVTPTPRGRPIASVLLVGIVVVVVVVGSLLSYDQGGEPVGAARGSSSARSRERATEGSSPSGARPSRCSHPLSAATRGGLVVISRSRAPRPGVEPASHARPRGDRPRLRLRASLAVCDVRRRPRQPDGHSRSNALRSGGWRRGPVVCAALSAHAGDADERVLADSPRHR